MSIYFDNAATSHPKPPEVIRAVVRAMTELNANPGRSGHSAALAAARQVLRTRESLAELLHAPDAMSIVHCFNCTDALNLAIKGSLRAGDHVVATRLEHNSVLRVLGELARRERISLTLVSPRPDGFIDPEDVDGYEVFNGDMDSDSQNDVALALATYLRESGKTLIMTSGSDHHNPDHLPAGGIETDEPITSMDQLISVLRSGEYGLIKRSDLAFRRLWGTRARNK